MTVLDDVRGLTDTGLLDAYRAAGDDAAARSVLAEAARRDREERAARAREQLRGEWYDAMFADFLAAEAECRGNLLSREGLAAGIADPISLWSGPREQAMRFASEELRDWWAVHPRLTVTEYARQRSAAGRIARQEWLEATAAEGTETTSTERNITDGHDQHDAGGPRLADYDAGAFRPGSAPAEAPQDGGRGTVRGGGPAPAGRREWVRPDGTAMRRAGGPAQSPRGVMAMTYTNCAETEPLPTEYLLRGHPKVPRGDVTLVFGDGAAGKGRLIMSWVAEVINSDDEAVVILILPEDHPAEEVVPRLIAAGVRDRSRVVNMTRLRGGSRFKLSADTTHDGHIGLLREAVEDINADKPGQPRRRVRMIVIDPVAAVVGFGSIQTNSGARRLLEPIQDLCQDTGIAGVVVAHTVTGGKLQGSYGLQQAARVVYRVARDRNNPTVRVIGVEKANNLPPTEDLRFVIEGDELGHVKVVMLDQAETDRRNRSWREAPEPPAQAAGCVGALMGIQRPGQARPEVTVLARYPAGDLGERLARTRCEAHPRFRSGAGWRPASDGSLLSRYVADDGAVIRFAVTEVAS